jgi:alanyl-tRNA synthetase
MRQDWRIEFACGGRAERLATADFQLLRTIGEKLSCAPEEAMAVMDKVASERGANFKSLRTTLQQLAEARAALMMRETVAGADGGRVIAAVFEEENPEQLLSLATELAKNERTVALLVHGETGQLVFAQHATGVRDLASVLKQVLAVVPGKGGGTRDFVRAKLAEPSRAAEAVETARALATK